MKDKHLKISSDLQLLNELKEVCFGYIKTKKESLKWILIVKFLFYALLVVSTYFLLLHANTYWVLIFLYILYGLFSLLLAFNFAHDFSHDTIFKSKKLNNFFFIAIYTLTGAHAEAWKYRHINSHHFAPNVDKYDSDLQITDLIRVTPQSNYKWYHRYQHIYAPIMYMTYSMYWVFIKDFIIYKQDFKKKNSKYHVSFWLQKIIYVVYILIIPLMYVSLEWDTVLTGFLLMHFIQSLFLLYTFFITHHVEGTLYPKTDEKGIIQSSWTLNQIMSSNDIHPFSDFANFIFGGFNNHIAHHLFPQIHHIYYPELSKRIYKIIDKYKIVPNNTTYLGGVKSHMKLLHSLSRN